MKYAVIEIGGKQLLVEEGKYYATNRLPNKAGSSLMLQRILPVSYTHLTLPTKA